MNFLLKLVALISLGVNKITIISSCFWFAYEPDIPTAQKENSDKSC